LNQTSLIYKYSLHTYSNIKDEQTFPPANQTVTKSRN